MKPENTPEAIAEKTKQLIEQVRQGKYQISQPEKLLEDYSVEDIQSMTQAIAQEMQRLIEPLAHLTGWLEQEARKQQPKN